MSRKDMKHLIARLKRQGYRVRLARSGHWRVSDGRRTVTVPHSPSCSRSLPNAVRDLRRYLGADL